MTHGSRLLPLALGAAMLSACATMQNPFDERGGPPPYGQGPYGGPPPLPYPGPPMPGPGGVFFHAVGQEPGWTLDIDAREMRFSGAYGEGPISQPTPRAINGFAGEIYQTPRLNVNVVHGQCRDAMSGRAYPSKVQIRADNRSFEGCGGPPEALSQAPPAASGPLADSHWRVVSINGRTTPSTDQYRVDFTVDRVGARFGCNSFNGSYFLDRDMMSTGPIMATKMACRGEAGRFESQGGAVLALPARVRFSPGHLTLTNNAGIVELERS